MKDLKAKIEQFGKSHGTELIEDPIQGLIRKPVKGFESELREIIAEACYEYENSKLSAISFTDQLFNTTP